MRRRLAAEAVTWEDYDEQLVGSVRSSLNVLRSCLQGMKDEPFGRIIAIGSNLVQHPVVAYHNYTTAKAAQLGWVRNMASELGERGITVNMVSGGLLKTTDASAATSGGLRDHRLDHSLGQGDDAGRGGRRRPVFLPPRGAGPSRDRT